MSEQFTEDADALLRTWLLRDDCFKRGSADEDGFWRFVVALLRNANDAEKRLSIADIDRRVRQRSLDIRGSSGTDEVAIYRLVSQIESVYCFLDAQSGVVHQKEYLE